MGELRSCQQGRLYESTRWIAKELRSFFIKGDEELKGSTIYRAFLLWISCGSNNRFSEVLRTNDVGVLSVEDLQ